MKRLGLPGCPRAHQGTGGWDRDRGGSDTDREAFCPLRNGASQGSQPGAAGGSSVGRENQGLMVH